MHDGCNSRIRHSFILKILENSEYLKLYKKYLGMAFVEENKKMKYCPAPDC